MKIKCLIDVWLANYAVDTHVGYINPGMLIILTENKALVGLGGGWFLFYSSRMKMSSVLEKLTENKNNVTDM